MCHIFSISDSHPNTDFGDGAARPGDGEAARQDTRRRNDHGVGTHQPKLTHQALEVDQIETAAGHFFLAYVRFRVDARGKWTSCNFDLVYFGANGLLVFAPETAKRLVKTHAAEMIMAWVHPHPTPHTLHHPDAGSSWPSWPRVSRPSLLGRSPGPDHIPDLAYSASTPHPPPPTPHTTIFPIWSHNSASTPHPTPPTPHMALLDRETAKRLVKTHAAEMIMAWLHLKSV